MSQPASALFPDEMADIREEVRDFFGDAQLGDQWLATGNSLFGGRKPEELIGMPDEDQLRNAIRLIKYVGMS